MAKSYSLAFISLFLLLFNSCQSIEQISIDYLQPADLSFPPQLRKVAVVNNTSDAPDNKLITEVQKTKENVPEVSRATAYANGDPKIAAESLAEEIAHQNYFDEVVICDSALRANDKLARENMLSQEEVSQLASDLGVDFIQSNQDHSLSTRFQLLSGSYGCKSISHSTGLCAGTKQAHDHPSP